MRKVSFSKGLLLFTTVVSAGLMLTPAAGRLLAPTETPVPVRTVLIQRGELRAETAMRGTLRYEHEYAVLAPTSGVVAEVYVSPGEQVQKGQALLRMDSTAEAAAITQTYAAAASGRLDSLPEDVDAAELAGAMLTEKQALLQAMTLRAAADGMVVEVVAGQYSGVAAGTPAVVLCSGAQEIVCMAAVTDASKMTAGMGSQVIVQGETLCGTVRHVGAAQADALTGQTVCTVTLSPEKEISLPVGATVEVKIERIVCSSVPVVPDNAVTADETVWIVQDGRCWEMAVEILRREGRTCWVAMPEGTAVVLDPAGLTDGQRVTEVQS